jgi:hypothetical protein
MFVEVLAHIREAEATSGATYGKEGKVRANTLTSRQLHGVAAPRLGCETRGTAEA